MVYGRGNTGKQQATRDENDRDDNVGISLTERRNTDIRNEAGMASVVDRLRKAR